MANVSPIVREEEGSRLRAAFQRMKLTKRITQADIAVACGWTSASTFNRILSGKIPLTLESLMKLASALGVVPSSISPRLIQHTDPGQGSKVSRMLPVSSVKDVKRGSWGEPFLTTLRLSYFTADQTSHAILFDAETAPAGLSGWVVVIEPAAKAKTGDFVVLRHSPGKYSYGRLAISEDDGSYTVDVEGIGKILSTPRRCMLVASLCRKADLRDYRS